MHNTVILEANGRLIHFSLKGFKGFTGLYSRTLTWLANLLKVCIRGFGLENLLFVLFTKVNLRKVWGVLISGQLTVRFSTDFFCKLPHSLLAPSHYHLIWGEFQKVWTEFGFSTRLSPINSPCVQNSQCSKLSF